ncbi:DUF3761 domain-containing protein [Streptomyces sp. NPDC045456]|uniref:DUF3761 domain-containing protein n=1 Tax=Streptomyces sp. NPDC045456 TaxID=3155254 RepID=UPI00340B0F80
MDGDDGSSSKPKPTATTEANAKLPDYTGKTLQAARDDALALGISTFESRELGGSNRLVLADINWKVCSTEPAAGAVADDITKLVFDVVKVGEDCLPDASGWPGVSTAGADTSEPSAEPTVDPTEDDSSVSTASGGGSDSGSAAGGSSSGSGSDSGSDSSSSSSSSDSGGTSHPAGATALCNDGTYSYSQHRRGTCSHHHGVATWLR